MEINIGALRDQVAGTAAAVAHEVQGAAHAAAGIVTAGPESRGGFATSFARHLDAATGGEGPADLIASLRSTLVGAGRITDAIRAAGQDVE